MDIEVDGQSTKATKYASLSIDMREHWKEVVKEMDADDIQFLKAIMKGGNYNILFFKYTLQAHVHFQRDV